MFNSKGGSGSVSKGRARSDPAWKHCKEVERDDGKYYKYVVCNYCQQKIKGGVSRLKHHLAQTQKDVRKCLRVPDDVKDEMKKYLKIKENAKEVLERSFDERVDTGSYYRTHTTEDEIQEKGGSCPGSSGGLSSRGVRGPLDRFFPSQGNDHGKGHIPPKDAKEASKLVTLDVGRFFFENGIPFNVASSPSFVSMLRSVGDYGRGYKAPSPHDLSSWVLQTEVETTRKIVEDVRKTWKATGVTIMSDGVLLCFTVFYTILLIEAYASLRFEAYASPRKRKTPQY
ncbi:hypothetical protein EZV62_024881 [Acer yangbiense]|uniref:BED-type domain-containing protein n=1 Tax=Acer yangbiense TaxID=1000413 RepID=A0A5C7GY71_9ROSI|nr:hypothetical protein EZV62_024881 [Acer yangbiense]